MIENLSYSVKSVPADKFSGFNPDWNLTYQASAQMWPYLAKSALVKIWSYCKIGSGRNLVESSQVDLDWNFVKSTLAQIWSRRPRPKFVWKSSKFIPCWNLASLAPTKNLPNSMVH